MLLRVRDEILFRVEHYLFKSNTHPVEYQWTLSVPSGVDTLCNRLNTDQQQSRPFKPLKWNIISEVSHQISCKKKNKKKLFYFTLLVLCHVEFPGRLCPGCSLLLPSVSARCQQLTNFGGVACLSSPNWNDLLLYTKCYIPGVDKIPETLALCKLMQRNRTRQMAGFLHLVENMLNVR